MLKKYFLSMSPCSYGKGNSWFGIDEEIKLTGLSWILDPWISRFNNGIKSKDIKHYLMKINTEGVPVIV